MGGEGANGALLNGHSQLFTSGACMRHLARCTGPAFLSARCIGKVVITLRYGSQLVSCENRCPPFAAFYPFLCSFLPASIFRERTGCLASPFAHSFPIGLLAFVRCLDSARILSLITIVLLVQSPPSISCVTYEYNS